MLGQRRVFGPLTVRPGLWDKGIGQRLMEPIIDCFERQGVTQVGLFTFAQSPKHIGLYQKYGFWPRFLTAMRISGSADKRFKGVSPYIAPISPADTVT